MSIVRSIEVERIPHRELRNNSSDILRRVAAGESFEITNHGEVVAILRSPSEEERWRSQIAKPATTSQAWRTIERVTSSLSTQQVLDELREERL